MNKLLLFLSLIAVSCGVRAQESIFDAAMGFRPSGKKDTIKAVFLIDDARSAIPVKVRGWFARSQMKYFGDRMPPGEYDDYWQEGTPLMGDKKTIIKQEDIWNYKLKNW